MRVSIQPLYLELNPGVGDCALGCHQKCLVAEKAPDFLPPEGCSCPLFRHQAETAAAVMHDEVDIIFNTQATGGGKSLASSLPVLLDANYQMVGLYPTNELIDDRFEGEKDYHKKFGLNPDKRVDLVYGKELSRRVKAKGSNRFQELKRSIFDRPMLLTNPDIFHYILHYRYRNLAYDNAELPVLLAELPFYWAIDEFHIFGPHQETAMLNNLCFISSVRRGEFKFLFTSATPKQSFTERLVAAGFKVREIKGNYSNDRQPNYRCISQAIDLEFVNLKSNDLDRSPVNSWLESNASRICEILESEQKGRGLIVLNSIAQVSMAVKLLTDLLPSITVREISGRIDRREREEVRDLLKNSPESVLVIGTSAVDVGVDFKIGLLIFESSDSATNIQRFGRLGRHSGFDSYYAYCLINSRTPWVYSRLKEALTEEETIDRGRVIEAMNDAFDSLQEFQEYRNYWGSLQSQGMLQKIREYPESRQVMEPVCQRIIERLTPVYPPNKLHNKQWHCLSKSTQAELLRFRGSTGIQAAVWEPENDRFYTYDFLRLLPHVNLEIIDEASFLKAAGEKGYEADDFSYAKVYCKVNSWVDRRIDFSLKTTQDTSNLTVGDLIDLKGLRIDEHLQVEVVTSLSQQQILGFLIPLGKKESKWDVTNHLHLNSTFGIYDLVDSGCQKYACAFNQDALLLKSLSHRMKKKWLTSNSGLFF